MKTFALLLIPALAAATAIADPIQPKSIPADAKWVVHLDVENLTQTKLGEFVGNEILDKQLAKPRAQLQQHLGIEVDWRDIQSITVFGKSLKKSADRQAVLMIRSRHDIPASLDSVVEKFAAQKPNEAALQKSDEDGATVYALKNEAFGSPVGRDLFLVSKSREQLAAARRVLDGKAPNVTNVKSFPALHQPAGGFLVAAINDAFSNGIKLPPQAEGLKNAESGQIVAGEKEDRIFVNLSVNTKEAEAATKLQQVVQGLIALASLAQAENPDIQKLAQGTKVTSEDKTVQVRIDVSAADVIAKVTEKHAARKNRP